MAQPLSPIFQRNLAALAKVNRPVAERICGPVGNTHLREDDDGSLSYRLHHSWHSVDLGDDAVRTSIDGKAEASDILSIGVGRGEILDALLARTAVGRITAWDSDPYLVRLLLTSKDYSQPIAAGRLRLALCADLVEVLSDTEVQRELVLHPFLARVYRNEARLALQGLGERRALICEGTLFVDDLADALREQGLSVWTWPITRLSPDELMRIARTVQPEFVASINYFHGLAEACQDAGLPLIAWEIDPSTDPLQPTGAASGTHVFTYRKAHVEAFQQAGFHRVSYLPLAANPDKRRPVELDETEFLHYGADIAFVGNSMVAQATAFQDELISRYLAWRGGDPAAAQAEIEGHLAVILGAQAEDWSDYRLPDLAQLRMPEFLAALGSQGGTDPVTQMAEMAAADKRIVYVGNLGQVGIKVWGDEGWRVTEADGTRYMGPAGHHEELTKIYGSTGINIDIGRLYQNDIVTMRVFDVMSCGGFVLAEYSDALVELFEPGEHLDCFRTLQELLDKVGYYLEHRDEAARIARSGMEAVRADHTIAHRVRHMMHGAGLRPTEA